MIDTGVSDGREAKVRRNILAVAAETFDRRGLRRTTMDEIAEAAGVTRKTVYNYFDNKPKLIGAVIEDECMRVAAAAREVLDFTAPPEDLIVDAVMALLDKARGTRYEEWLMRPDSMPIGGEVLARSQAVADIGRNFWMPILEPLRDAGRLRVTDLHEVVEWMTFFRIVLLARPATFDGDPAWTRRMLRTYLIPALLKPADTASA